MNNGVNLTLLGTILTFIAGWITNIVNIISNPNPLTEWTTMNLVEVIGIFVAPLGTILGIMSWF